MVKKLILSLLLGLFIASCNQGDYTYTRTGYESCRCAGNDEFSCIWHGIGYAVVNPMHRAGTRVNHNC